VLKRILPRWPGGTQSERMAKAKSTKPRDLIRWRVSLITATPAKFIDFTMAPDAETAEEQVVKEHKIGDTLRNRLAAIREDLARPERQRGTLRHALQNRRWAFTTDHPNPAHLHG
jgi:hypothetical protein